MGILADETTEEKLIRSLKFVKVAVQDSHTAKIKHGYLTDISVAMLLVEMKRNGLTISNGHQGGEA